MSILPESGNSVLKLMMTMVLRSRGIAFVKLDSLTHYLCLAFEVLRLELVITWGLVGGHPPCSNSSTTSTGPQHMGDQVPVGTQGGVRFSLFCEAFKATGGQFWLLGQSSWQWTEVCLVLPCLMDQDETELFSFHIVVLSAERPIQTAPQPWWGRRHLGILIWAFCSLVKTMTIMRQLGGLSCAKYYESL